MRHSVSMADQPIDRGPDLVTCGCALWVAIFSSFSKRATTGLRIVCTSQRLELSMASLKPVARGYSTGLQTSPFTSHTQLLHFKIFLLDLTQFSLQPSKQITAVYLILRQINYGSPLILLNFLKNLRRFGCTKSNEIETTKNFHRLNCSSFNFFLCPMSVEIFFKFFMRNY